MLVSIHQPHYLPWLRYLDKIARSDVFLILDDAEFNKNGWQNRNRVKAPEGARILTLPVHHRLGQRIDEIALRQDLPWARKHLKTLEQLYARAPFLAELLPGLRGLYERPWTSLVDLAVEMLKWHMELLEIRTPLVRTSELGVGGRATPRLVDLVRAVGGSAYLTGAHALGAYLEPTLFEEAGLGLRVHEWACPAYDQVHPQAGFVRDLATLDLLLAEGPRSREILARGGRVVEGPAAPSGVRA